MPFYRPKGMSPDEEEAFWAWYGLPAKHRTADLGRVHENDVPDSEFRHGVRPARIVPPAHGTRLEDTKRNEYRDCPFGR